MFEEPVVAHHHPATSDAIEIAEAHPRSSDFINVCAARLNGRKTHRREEKILGGFGFQVKGKLVWLRYPVREARSSRR
jgi:hypothetical protein